MPITYTIDHDKQLIYETWTGEVSAADLAAYWENYLSNPAVMAIRRTVVDLRAATLAFSGLDFDSLIQQIVLPILGERKWISAIVVGNPVQQGLHRHDHRRGGELGDCPRASGREGVTRLARPGPIPHDFMVTS
jgi:hypothetical protein